MKITKERIMNDNEVLYTKKQMFQIQMQTGYIGIASGRFDDENKNIKFEWSSSYTDNWSFDFMNELLEIAKYILTNKNIDYQKIRNKHWFKAGLQIEPDDMINGYRFDTETYTYLLTYNADNTHFLNIYCYVKEYLNRHLENAKNGIRFIDTNYNTLFTIPDGGEIIVNGVNVKCKYIDDYHFFYGEDCFHICEFAERIEKGNVNIRLKEEGGK